MLYNISMRDRKAIREAKKEFQQHYFNNKDNYKSFSRLERCEYAYETMRLARNYTCLKNGLDPEKVDFCFESCKDGAGGRANLYHDQKTNSFRGLFTLSTKLPFQTFSSAASAYIISFHEMKHIVDKFEKYNKQQGQEHKDKPASKPIIKNISKFESNRQYNLANSYSKFGVAWYGSPSEIRADKNSYSEMLKLSAKAILKSEDKVKALKSFGKNLSIVSKNMSKHYLARSVLPIYSFVSQFTRFDKEKGIPVQQTGKQETEQNAQNTNYRQFVSLHAMRMAADKNPSLFKERDYLQKVAGREISNPDDVDEQTKSILQGQHTQAVEEVEKTQFTINQEGRTVASRADENYEASSSPTVNEIVQGIMQTREDMEATRVEMQDNTTSEGFAQEDISQNSAEEVVPVMTEDTSAELVMEE